MSWARATATGTAIVAVAIAFLAYIPNMIVTKLHWSRSTRVALCTIVVSVALALILAALRRLQARQVI